MKPEGLLSIAVKLCKCMYVDKYIYVGLGQIYMWGLDKYICGAWTNMYVGLGQIDICGS